MGILYPLGKGYVPSSDEVQELIDDAPRCKSLREMVQLTIRAIHGLPDALEADGLKQLVVYLGRAGATPEHLWKRWEARHEEFDTAPSTHAMVVARASTALVRNERWEEAGVRIIKALDRHKALCVANAYIGSTGRWPRTRETVIYLVARKQRGTTGPEVSPTRLSRAVMDLLDDDTLEDDVVREVRLIAKPHEADEHDLFIDPDRCRHEGCPFRALPGNYGFCGHHR